MPDGFPEWSGIMTSWGKSLYTAVDLVSEMLARGLGLDAAAFTRLTRNGPHLLAPTGTRLNESNAVLDKVYAGFHTDLNFITIHGQSRYPGLFIWPKDGKKIQVRVPRGCLLLQAGKQLELLTAGLIQV